jgi:hypothetical protein
MGLEPDEIWSRLLSGDPAKIRFVWTALDTRQKRSVRAHLKEMISGHGWQPGQRKAAQSALDYLESLRDDRS